MDCSWAAGSAVDDGDDVFLTYDVGDHTKSIASRYVVISRKDIQTAVPA